MDTPTLRTLQSLSGTYSTALRFKGEDHPDTAKARSALRLAKAKIYLARLEPVLTPADLKALKAYTRGL